MAAVIQPEDEQTPEEYSGQVIAQSAQWTGPLPPPAALEHFERIIPGGAERILRMAEQEQAHRIQLDKISISASIPDTKRGQYIGAAIATLAIVAAVVTVCLGGPWQVAVALVGVPVLSVHSRTHLPAT